ncbi:SHN SHINE DNA BINDING / TRANSCRIPTION FACTOR [Salix purpurea]|uniref:SHN SHINE DNA BINDING / TRANSCRIPTION FACTOR n=1 Tax=Salix purpurea TaxID=77065 RepID=A0A9Q0SJ11_SALPP|nr:SHN SHINE DNA BINDING / TRANSCRIPTION FACTOR [Salix purpurea]
MADPQTLKNSPTVTRLTTSKVQATKGTCDTPEEAARAYDEAARALRSDGRHVLSFSSLKAKMSKNLQSIMARTTENESTKNRIIKPSCSWETSCVSDCSNEWIGFRQHGFDSDGSDIGEVSTVNSGQMTGWIDSPYIKTCCGDPCSRSKRFKVSSSVVVPPTFSGPPSFCASSPSFCGSPFHVEN